MNGLQFVHVPCELGCIHVASHIYEHTMTSLGMEGLGESEKIIVLYPKTWKIKLVVFFEQNIFRAGTELGFIIRMRQNINKGLKLILIGTKLIFT